MLWNIEDRISLSFLELQIFTQVFINLIYPTKMWSITRQKLYIFNMISYLTYLVNILQISVQNLKLK